MIDVIIGLVILVIFILAVRYIVRARKKGQRCIGCPASSKCSGHCH